MGGGKSWLKGGNRGMGGEDADPFLGWVTRRGVGGRGEMWMIKGGFFKTRHPRIFLKEDTTREEED